MNNKVANKMKGRLEQKLLKRFCLVSIYITTLFLLYANVYAQDYQDGYKITSPITGVINKVHVKNNQSVKKGDVLLSFDSSLIESSLSEVQARLKWSQMNLTEAKNEYERAEELYDRTVLSDHDLQKAKIAYFEAKAQFSRVKNQLIHAQWDKKHSQLIAPFSGKVIKVMSYEGHYVNNEMAAQTLLIMEKQH